MERWEWLLGDGHFTEPQFLIPYRNSQGHPMPEYQQLVNIIIAHYRARIEHINAVFDAHKMFQTDYRGSFDLLQACTHVNAHATNITLLRHPRYPPCGPWLHDAHIV